MMNLTIKKEQVIDGFLKAASIIPNKTGAAYLRSLWIQAREDRIILMSTDGILEFTGKYPAEVKEEGQAGVNGRAFVELVRRLPEGDIHLKVDEEKNILLVEQSRRSYKLPTIESTWFQPLPDFPKEGAVLWSGDFLQDIIDKVSFCISDEEKDSGLACLLIKKFKEDKVDACGLNGHQFAMVRFSNAEIAQLLPESGLLLQKNYVNELRKWLVNDEIMLNISESRFHISTGSGNETLSMPHSSNFSYPEYLNFLSRLKVNNASYLTVDKKEGIEALDRLLIFSTEDKPSTYLKFSASEVELSAEGQKIGSATEHLEGDFRGDISVIAFPTRNLFDIFSHFQSSKIEFTLTGKEGPCGIRGADDAGYTVILMPMRIEESSYYSEE